MKMKTKIMLFTAEVIVFMFLLPLAIISFSPADIGMGLCMILFFAVDPLLSIGIGILAGSEIKRTWWMPILNSLLFPLLFSLAVTEFISELFVYSLIYAGIGVVAMLLTALISRKYR